MELYDLPLILCLLILWQEITVKQLSCGDKAVASCLKCRLGDPKMVGWWFLNCGMWSKASIVLGSIFPSAIAVASEGGKSLIAVKEWKQELIIAKVGK